MKTIGTPGDVALKDLVESELKWEPSVDEAGVGVIVEDGVVTLSGTVPEWPQRSAAERATLRLSGVKAVANEIAVKLPGASDPTDAEIAREAARALEWNTTVPRDRVKVSVHNGFVSLKGEVEWQFQKKAAEEAVEWLRGVRGTLNEIAIETSVAPADIRKRILEALERNAVIESRGIQVEAHDRQVTLTGSVFSWLEREQVEQAAWAAPGVSSVRNHLKVTYG